MGAAKPDPDEIVTLIPEPDPFATSEPPTRPSLPNALAPYRHPSPMPTRYLASPPPPSAESMTPATVSFIRALLPQPVPREPIIDPWWRAVLRWLGF